MIGVKNLVPGFVLPKEERTELAAPRYFVPNGLIRNEETEPERGPLKFPFQNPFNSKARSRLVTVKSAPARVNSRRQALADLNAPPTTMRPAFSQSETTSRLGTSDALAGSIPTSSIKVKSTSMLDTCAWDPSTLLRQGALQPSRSR